MSHGHGCAAAIPKGTNPGHRHWLARRGEVHELRRANSSASGQGTNTVYDTLETTGWYPISFQHIDEGCINRPYSTTYQHSSMRHEKFLNTL